MKVQRARRRRPTTSVHGRHLAVLRSTPDREPPEPLPLAPAPVFGDVNDLVRQLASEGFAPGQPAKLTAAVDRNVCAALHCPACGREGLEYRPHISSAMHRAAARGAYRPLAVCTACAIGTEF